jgi:hypothetical protein
MRLLSFIAFILTGCGSVAEADHSPSTIEYPDDVIEVEAKVTYQPFVNKAGKTIEGAGDYFLVYEGEEWFIKFSEGNVLREDVAKYLDQTAHFTLVEREGLWDTDDPKVQSRIGKYVVVYLIQP